nr:hypothetical protein [uncultured Arsenicibacter sp.]
MTPVKFIESNFVYKAEGCNDLPVFKGQDGEGRDVIISAWELTPEEKEQVMATGRIYLMIWSNVQPPVLVTPSTPFRLKAIDN